MPDRDALIQQVKDTWPDAGSGFYPARGQYITIPPVRSGGTTEGLIEHAVDTVLAALEEGKS